MLARRDMSRAELEARLAGRRGRGADDVREHGADSADGHAQGDHRPSEQAPGPPTGPEAVASALDRLAAIGLQSDSRFAENYVRGREARMGRRRLVAELRQRGVDGDTIDAALSGLESSELQRARALWSGRFAATRDPRERARQMRFLAARGFEMAVIRAVVGGQPGDADGDPDLTTDDH